MKLGAQLYTVREFTKDLDGISESLKKIADIGYTTVQVSGTCPYEGEWLREELEKNGLECVLTHYPPKLMLPDLSATMAKHAAFGCRRIGLGHYDLENRTLEDFYEEYLPVAKTFKDNGFKFYYHNHFNEFRIRDGKTYLEHICEAFSEDLLGIILDTYWVQKSGADPIMWIERLAGRVDCVHFKDMKFNGDMAVVGEGNMNFDGIVSACEKVGTEYALVEQDDCYGEDPFDCLKRSYAYLSSMGLK